MNMLDAHERVPFRNGPFYRKHGLSAAMAAIGLTLALTSPSSRADAGTEAALREENARLRAEIERLRQTVEASPAARSVPPDGGAATADADAASAATPGGAAAQAAEDAPVELDAVVIRARNRLERLQDVPLSISAISGRELEREGAVTLGDITRRAANVQWNVGNARQSSLSIRGVGKQGQTDAMDPSVGVIVDGVNYAYGALSFADFIDVDAVEVARGPQGTLLGRNTTMGVVNITTRKPSFTPEAIFETTFGKNNTLIGKAVGGGAVIDDLLAWRGNFYIHKQRGDFRNENNDGTQSWPDINRMAGRAQILLTPTPDFSARVSFDIQPRNGQNDNGLTYYTQIPRHYANGESVPLSAAVNRAENALGRRWFTQQDSYSYAGDYLRAINYDNYQPLFTGSDGASAELNWTLGNHVLTAITAYKDFYFDARNDEGTPFDITLNNNTSVEYKQISQELRLSSQAGGALDYQTGLFWLKTRNRVLQKQEWGSDAGAWFASNAQYNALDANGEGRYLLDNSLNRLFRQQREYIHNQSIAGFGQANWHIGDKFTLTSGVRLTHEDRRTQSRRDVLRNGYGAELNPVAVNGVQLGGFDSDTTGELTSSALSSPDQLALANFTASKYFGVADYAALSAAQKQQIAHAKTLRRTQIGTLWLKSDGESFRKTQPALIFSPSYKINDDVTIYASWQYGEKAGIVQFTNGLPNNADPEKATAYEIGLKSALFNRSLILNAALFRTDLRDYQQSVQVVDPLTTQLTGETAYTSATGNVKHVQITGLEIDGAYGGIKNTTLRFSAAWNRAIYKDFTNSSAAPELANLGLPYLDQSGKSLPGAPRFTLSVGGEYRLPILGDKEFHASINHFYTTRQNLDNTLSEYGWQKAYHLTDLSVGFGRRDQSFDLNFVVKNLFDTHYNTGQSWASYTPGAPRWFGLVLKAKL
ncbi:MAG: TonB-dependent receptor [Azoarcus sp.]|nr:TonB-dependent receptor [Azoarcus sp.]